MKKASVYLYGFISRYFENTAEDFARQLNEAAATADEIELHVHCYGGSVFEGNNIYNAIKKCPKPVDVYIDGISASMATVIMLAGRNIYMSENAFLMLHAPSGSVDGTAEEMRKSAKMLDGIEQLFKKYYSAKTGKTDAEVAEWLKGDNWFTSQEALAAKLIDGIVDPITTSAPGKEEIKNINAKAVYDRFVAITIPTKLIENNMKKEELIARYGLTGVTSESSDDAVMAAIDTKLKEGQDEVKKLQDEKKAQATAAIKAEVKAAADAKKITTEQIPTFETIGETSGLDALKTALAAIKPTPTITGMLGKTPEASADKNGWDWDKWQKEDPRGLEAMSKSDPETFQALYDAKFKK